MQRHSVGVRHERKIFAACPTRNSDLSIASVIQTMPTIEKEKKPICES